VGFSTATDVTVTWEITDPPGVGISGANGWQLIGTVEKTQFSGLASIPANSYVDVYVEWTPNFTISPEDMAAGLFAFHTCIRVRLNHVSNETVFGNQDGDGEQENISYFQAPVSSPGEPVKKGYKYQARLRNDDMSKKKSFLLTYKTHLPLDWKVELNDGVHSVDLAPNEVRDIPVSIIPGAAPVAIGSIFGTDISASYLRLLVDDLNPKNVHPEYKPLGGVRVETRVLKATVLDCKVGSPTKSRYPVAGILKGTEFFYPNQKQPLSIQVIGVDKEGRFLRNTQALLPVRHDGKFKGYVVSREQNQKPNKFACMFAGTDLLASSASKYLPIP
jgi:hypothetical protein